MTAVRALFPDVDLPAGQADEAVIAPVAMPTVYIDVFTKEGRVHQCQEAPPISSPEPDLR